MLVNEFFYGLCESCQFVSDISTNYCPESTDRLPNLLYFINCYTGVDIYKKIHLAQKQK